MSRYRAELPSRQCLVESGNRDVIVEQDDAIRYCVTGSACEVSTVHGLLRESGIRVDEGLGRALQVDELRLRLLHESYVERLEGERCNVSGIEPAYSVGRIDQVREPTDGAKWVCRTGLRHRGVDERFDDEFIVVVTDAGEQWYRC